MGATVVIVVLVVLVMLVGVGMGLVARSGRCGAGGGGAGGLVEQLDEGVAAAFGQWPGVLEAVAAGVALVGLVVQKPRQDRLADGAGLEDRPELARGGG